MPDSQFGDQTYAEFQSGNQKQANIDFSEVDFVENYNNTADPWQLNNLASNSNGSVRDWTSTDSATQRTAKLHEVLRKWYTCAGDSCM